VSVRPADRRAWEQLLLKHRLCRAILGECNCLQQLLYAASAIGVVPQKADIVLSLGDRLAWAIKMYHQTITRYVGRICFPMEVPFHNEIEEPPVSRFNLGKILGHTSLIDGGCYFARSITAKNLIRGDFESFVSVRYLDYRLHRSREHRS
jgi:hypothetical protein